MSGEPPPLEDMSEHFLLKRPTKAAHPSSVDLGDKALEEAALAAKRKIYKNLENSDGVRDQVSKTAVSTEEPSRAEKNSSNFGFQAGFLNNSKPRPVQEKSNVEVIKPKNKPETSPLVFEPVQSALQDFINESSNNWMTPEFLSSISSPNSLLGKLMASDPNFGEAMELFSKSPTQALEKYRDRPEYVTALKEFSARIAERFEALADIEDEKKKRHMFQVSSSKVSTAGLPVHEQELVHKVMSDPNIQNALKDPVIQTILLKMKNNPSVYPRELIENSSNKDVQEKLAILIKAGLLSFEK